MDVNEDDRPFAPSTLEECAKETEELRMRCLFGVDSAGAEPFAEQHYLLALAALEQAKRHFSLAKMFQSRALAGNW